MERYKSTKRIAVAIALMMLIASLCLPLAAAKGRKGSTVEVTLADGNRVRGELLAVKSDVLLIRDPDTGQGWSIDLQQLTQVRIMRESKFLLGMIFGVNVGLGMTKYIKEDRAGLFYGLNSACLVLATGLICGFVGSAAGKDKKIPMDGVSILIAQQNLERLRRYAREVDFTR
jgi:hypothetical protein